MCVFQHHSRNNSASQADYNKIPKQPVQPHGMVVPPPNINGNMNGNSTPNGSGGPFKPVPPPKPKNYRPPMQNSGNGNGPNQWQENGVSFNYLYKNFATKSINFCI